jgi:hypothetical protein
LTGDTTAAPSEQKLSLSEASAKEQRNLSQYTLLAGLWSNRLASAFKCKKNASTESRLTNQQKNPKPQRLQKEQTQKIKNVTPNSILR